MQLQEKTKINIRTEAKRRLFGQILKIRALLLKINFGEALAGSKTKRWSNWGYPGKSSLCDQ